MNQLTLEQKQAISMAEKGLSIKMLAFAGGGKTSTLYAIANALKKQNKRGLYLAFNKAIANEAQEKMPENVTARTFHSLAYKSTPYQITRRVALKETPRDFINRHNLKDIYNVKLTISVVGGSKNAVCMISAYRLRFLILESLKYYCRSDSDKFTPTLVMEAINKHEPNICEQDKQTILRRIYPVATDLMLDYFSPNGIYPLNDFHDIYLKFWALTKPVIHADFIMFDEAQDADPIMRSILEKQKCQIIYVGDPYQQIYSWRGAVNAMQSINAQTCYLSQSFRFGPQLAQKAQMLLDHLGSPVAIRGDNSKSTKVDISTYDKAAKFNAYICRTNAGIVEAAFWHIKKGIEFAVVGMNFKEVIDIIVGLDDLDLTGKSTHPLVKDFGSIKDLDQYLDATPGDMQLQPYRKLHRIYGGDKILEMIENLRNTKITKSTVVGVTAHSAKGLEYDHVCLASDFMNVFFDEDKNGKFICKQNVSPEEFRLLYVAITRARKCAYLKNVNTIFERLNEFSMNTSITKKDDDMALPDTDNKVDVTEQKDAKPQRPLRKFETEVFNF